ncbi:hypothetical protein LWC34_38575 [Kibdelosporangium philippinense]|uniref:Uncharacterized protein n=1 Tax=Kibdelosporangium philippinense TaxID=211113 RepID=A0ABS8ZLK6_9PSEU|nr:hypothetical protein [Kibdelosporangium philippinense]MCE7008678.1 hypothetical protein [Kibdelosporangium philippinense]
MIEVRSFLKQQDGSFQRYEETTVPPSDSDYVEGAIELVIDGVEVIGQQQWDYVDQLWAYIADMVSDLREHDEVRTTFPDMPVEFALRRTAPGRLLVSCESSTPTRVQAVETELVQALTQAGLAFFERMSRLLPDNAESYDLASESLREAAKK